MPVIQHMGSGGRWVNISRLSSATEFEASLGYLRPYSKKQTNKKIKYTFPNLDLKIVHMHLDMPVYESPHLLLCTVRYKKNRQRDEPQGNVKHNVRVLFYLQHNGRTWTDGCLRCWLYLCSLHCLAAEAVALGPSPPAALPLLQPQLPPCRRANVFFVFFLLHLYHFILPIKTWEPDARVKTY